MTRILTKAEGSQRTWARIEAYHDVRADYLSDRDVTDALLELREHLVEQAEELAVLRSEVRAFMQSQRGKR